MRPEIFKFLAEKQNTYWWNRARRAMGEALLRRYGVPESGCWLDLGCGTGGNLRIADSFHPDISVGVDISDLALELAQSSSPRSSLVRADVSVGLPFADYSFDVVTIFNVIYHEWIKDDAQALVEVGRVMRPGGFLLITEPAFPILARDWDKAVMGARRYRRGQLVSLCERAGLRLQFSSYFTSFGFPILIASKILKRLRGSQPDSERRDEARHLPRFLNESLFSMATIEARIIRLGLPIPFGITVLVLARRAS